MSKSRTALYTPLAAASALIFICLLAFLAERGQARQGGGQAQTAEILRPGAPTPGAAVSAPTAKELDDAATPVVDLGGTPAADAARASRNARRDGHGFLSVNPDRRAADVLLSRHGRAGLAELPAAESDLIVEGKVTGSAAYLSNDRGAVYSEFDVRVTDVLKAAPGVSARPGETVVAERLGGRVRYPDGRVVRYGVAGDGSPAKGKTYLFFLAAAEGGGFELLTAYEVAGGKARALDAQGGGRAGAAAERDYQGFGEAVRRAVKNAPGAARARRVIGS